jgi:hypothetical protein
VDLTNHILNCTQNLPYHKTRITYSLFRQHTPYCRSSLCPEKVRFEIFRNLGYIPCATRCLQFITYYSSITLVHGKRILYTDTITFVLGKQFRRIY